MSAEAFVDEVLVPFRAPPVPPAELVMDAAAYMPSSQRMAPPIAARFRGLAWDLIERSTDDPALRQRAADAVAVLLGRIDGDAVPGRRMRDLADAEVVEMYCELVRLATGVADPYAALKQAYNDEALRDLPQIHQAAARAGDAAARWAVAINLGILANAIDFADPTRKAHLDTNGFDLAAAVRQAAALRYVIDERAAFLAAMAARPGEAVFLADNAGEIVFDLPLIRLWLEQGRRVLLVGKSVPCYNDMTADDLEVFCRDPRAQAYLAPHGGRVAVIASGTAMIGLDLRRATPALTEAWSRAAIIYAKGQGMLQTLRYAPLRHEVFHAVQVKDPAYFHERIPVKAGDALFLQTRPGARNVKI